MHLLLLLATSLSSLYSSLDPTSVSQHFAFYELYPETNEGKDALRTAWRLLSANSENSDPEMILPALDPKPMINFINKGREESELILNEEELAVITKLSRHLLNRKLKGHSIFDYQTFLKLEDEEIDLARGLLLAELGDHPDKVKTILSYEAQIDLMALQIQARVRENATAGQKIRAINDYIFSEMRFRFPPHSLHAKDIDIYTFLPSVLDSRRGVCLGVSTLYLCLAQRLGLELEAITPPGHIYVRHVDSEGNITNIETTARGIDVPTEYYLGVDTCSLHKRTIREVIGLAFMNQAAVYWQREDSETAVKLYEKAQDFVKDDYLLNMFLGFNYLFTQREKEGKNLLKKIDGKIPDHMISPNTVIEDYLKGYANAEAIQTIYSEVNEKRESIIEKQKKLEKITQKYPKFRQAHFHLAITWLQLGREKEAAPILEKYVSMSPKDATANYYLAAIHFQRHNYNLSWKFLKAAEKIVSAKNHTPKALKSLRTSLIRACPEP